MIDGQPREFISVKVFRAEMGLSSDFGMELFMPKDYSGLGSTHHASAALQSVRQAILEAVPRQPPQSWLASTLALQIQFRKDLVAVNESIGLKGSEIEFAAMGFGEVLQAFVYALLQAQMKQTPPPSFSDVYQHWLNGTVAVSRATYFHRTQEPPWRIQLVRTAYGRCGLIIHTSCETHYVHDPVHSCPVESFMVSLLSDVAACFVVALKQNRMVNAV